ncbi:MAG: nuclear transport factor 2 family protein [Bacteroidales bacterium]
MRQFQEGYEARDTSVLYYFMDDLFSQENILILGTMPNEIYSGYDEASDLVRTDWLQWGDVRLLVQNANISTQGNVAWISTVGFVEFDLSRFLVLPLRFSGVLVQEDFGWKFQQVQFQFDLDSSFTVMAILLLWILFLLSVLRFFNLLYRLLRARSEI